MPPSILTDSKLAELVRDFPGTRIDGKPCREFLLWEDAASGMSQYYAPFEYLNQDAKLILIGITPGAGQMKVALGEAAKALRAGNLPEDSMRIVKREASFAGNPTRSNVIRILDGLGYNRMLKIRSCASLWAESDHLVHFTSILGNPVFTGGITSKDYTGSPLALSVPVLKRRMIEDLVPELAQISPTAVIVPLGEPVGKSIHFLHERGLIKQRVMMFQGHVVAPPHPSGANNELVNLLLNPSGTTADEYAIAAYQQYKLKHEQKGSTAKQTAETYMKKRRTHWNDMAFVRSAYASQALE
ncbi:MAG: hypothetical protein QE272_11005 [Nevskia sp.]|nr:hypothetical protein [Nevskia sp.]